MQLTNKATRQVANITMSHIDEHEELKKYQEGR